MADELSFTAALARLSRGERAILGLLGSIAMAGLVAGRGALLDDALIHLRYAENLVASGRLEFNPGQHSFGTSSPAWLVVLAGVSLFVHGSLGVKLVAVVVYAGLLGLLAWRWARTRALADLAALAACTSPMGVRWLADGMETGLGALLALGLVEVVRRPRWRGAIALIAFLGVTTRIEVTVLAGVLFVHAARRRARPEAAELASGAAAGVLITMVAMGHLTSDAALAKSRGFTFAPVSWVMGLAASHAAALSLGVGLVGALLVQVVAAWRSGRRWGAALALAPMAALVTAAIARGQEIQGIRYFVWPLLAGSWVASLPESTAEATPAVTEGATEGATATAQSAGPWARWRGARSQGLVAAAFGIAALFEAIPAGRILVGRGESLARMEAAGLDRLRGAPGVVWDVGYVGYLSQGDVCDVHGLVNGRAVARLDQDARMRRCVEASPEWTYATAEQLAWLEAEWPEARSWQSCPELVFAFPNVRTDDVHVVAMTPERAAELCREPISARDALTPE